ncbi:MAG: HEPN domain-containing protein [Elusimicrobiota bacterium]
MEVIVRKWLDYAKADLEAAEVLAKNPESHYSFQIAILHCHQAVEKILKTVTVAKGEEPRRVHNLIALAEYSKAEIPQDMFSYIEELNPYYQPARYPDLPTGHTVLKFDKSATLYHLKKTKKLFQWITEKYILKK